MITLQIRFYAIFKKKIQPVVIQASFHKQSTFPLTFFPNIFYGMAQSRNLVCTKCITCGITRCTCILVNTSEYKLNSCQVIEKSIALLDGLQIVISLNDLLFLKHSCPMTTESSPLSDRSRRGGEISDRVIANIKKNFEEVLNSFFFGTA